MVVTSASLDDLDRRYRNSVVYKLERMVCDMQHTESGVAFRAQKLFLTSIPAAVAGCDLIQWIGNYLNVTDMNEASHLANMLCSYGYVYPIAEGAASRTLVVKDEPTALYRFQAPYFWLSTVSRPDAMDYAIYLVKRSLRGREKLGLEEHEQEALQKLQKLLCDKWEFIHLQAEEQVRLCKERKKGDKIVLDDQERAFWRIHRPPPGATYHVEEALPTNLAPSQVEQRKAKARKERAKDLGMNGDEEVCQIINPGLSVKAADNLLQFYNNHKRFDAWVGSCEVGNYWLLDANSHDFPAATIPITVGITPSGSPNPADIATLDGPALNTSSSTQTQEFALPMSHEVKLWAVDFDRLLQSSCGLALLRQFLLKEFSTENVRFWQAVQEHKFGPISRMNESVEEIFAEYLKPGAASEINIDSKTMSATERNLKNPGRFTFEEAEEHIYNLMKKDSFTRFLRSEDYLGALHAATDRQSARMKGSGVGSWLPWQQTRRKTQQDTRTGIGHRRRGSQENMDSSHGGKCTVIIEQQSRSTRSQNFAELRNSEDGGLSEGLSARHGPDTSPAVLRPSSSLACKSSNVVAPWDDESPE